jgi:hypothetical protein
MIRRILALAIVCAAPAAAQSVSGIVSRGGLPVEGAIVALVDASGREINRVVSRDDGRYTIPSAPGSYSLRIIQIGWRPTVAGPFELRSDTRVMDVALVSPRLSLAAITVRSDAKCSVRPDSSQSAFAVWEAARSALLATSITRVEPFDVRMSQSERLLSTAGDVVSDSNKTQEGRSLSPFRSLPPAAIAASGFMTTDENGERTLWAPDADVLLSEEFIGSHCLAIQASADTSLVGVRFEPARKRRDFVDVEGVLWVDRRTTELRSLEYRYVQGPDILDRAQAGGRVEFLRIPRGRWVVSRWSIRQPAIRTRADGKAPIVPGARMEERTREELAGIKISSGSLTQITRNGLRLWERGRVSFVARVVDSVTDAPRARLLVGFATTGDRTSTDSLGQVRFELVEPGRHVLRVDDPELIDIRGEAVMREVEVPESNDAQVVVRMPSVRALVAAQCGERALLWGEGLLSGRVASWRAGDSTTTLLVVADTPYQQLGAGVVNIESYFEIRPARATGIFRVCGMPRDAVLRVRRAADDASTGVTTRFENGSFAAFVALP